MTAAPSRAASPGTSRPRRRVFSLDLIRALATLIIVLTHVNNPFLTDGRYLLTNQPFGVYVGDLGVSLFLIVSGASLATTYHGPLNLRVFFWKRFKGIYPMFWIAWLLGTLYFFVDMGGHPLNVAPARSLIWTVLGVDGLVANFGVHTAYLLGEWFLGFIILFYLVFPLLLAGVERWPKTTAAIILGLYLASLYVLRDGASFPSSVILTVRLPELVFGMYLVRYVTKVPPVVVVPALAMLVVTSVLVGTIPKDVATTAVGISVFLILTVLAPWVQIGPVSEAVTLVSTYSYPVFLVHHVIIYKLFLYSGLDYGSFYPVQLVVMLGVVCVLTLALAVALDRLTSRVVAMTARAFAGRWWRPQALVTGPDQQEGR
ncbi:MULTISPECIES: acyltransferase family protein [Actinomyces]|uniref:Acyltransferase n=1 Tax=Actinomyces respiraculi TaxID=2744574 RepID=A0A7T0LLC8_9ACTO|nr:MULTISPECIES: acyltransferase [Actinomyces]QPL05820.1 acyltransferase [Actinomyces respiraculi]